MAQIDPFLGADRPQSNNKLGIRNVYYQKPGDVYIVQKMIRGEKRHIAEFKSLEEARYFAGEMNKFDLKTESGIASFYEFARKYMKGHKK